MPKRPQAYSILFRSIYILRRVYNDLPVSNYIVPCYALILISDFHYCPPLSLHSSHTDFLVFLELQAMFLFYLSISWKDCQDTTNWVPYLQVFAEIIYFHKGCTSQPTESCNPPFLSSMPIFSLPFSTFWLSSTELLKVIYYACVLACSITSIYVLLCNPMEYSLPSFSVHRFTGKNTRVWCHDVLQGPSWPRDWTRFPALQANFLLLNHSQSVQ